MKRSTVLILAGLSILSVLTYLLVSRIYFRIGFPLDDSWIHQTYARNLARSGEWAFLPGQASGGSTSPLWTMILSIGYLIHISPYGWTFGMGILILWGVAYLAEVTVRSQVASYRSTFPWVGCLMVFEWHLTWAASSGMETLLFSAVVMWVLFSLIEENPKYFKIGILIGVGIWLRPDGLTLLGPACFVGLLDKSPITRKLNNIVRILLGFGGLFSLYLLFTLALTGTPWPTTFYAKQAEYVSLLDFSFVERIGRLSVQLIIGVGSILLPGYILTMVEAIRKQMWGFLAGLLWLLGMLGLYAWRLPVIYQHGRYVIPCMFVFFTFSCIGMMDYFNETRHGRRWVLENTWKMTIVLILIIFWGYGAIVYARDVAFIESEMVDTADWVNKNLPGETLIAAHDIGALGYFGNHKIFDLAGLISPDVIPFLRDEARLAEYLDTHNVDYLITFPEWYPSLVRNLSEVYSTHGRFAPAMGGENMVIYHWQD
jgi:putative effector of murein hydrolase LrgA (UPF0299 family)